MIKNLIFKIYKAIRALITKKITIECDSIPYHFNNVPYRKIFNWLFLEMSIFLKLKKPRGWPTHFLIEPTTLCNLKCALCPVTEGMNRPTGNMDPKLFKKLIDETGDYIFLILMWDWGEPFVNPKIYDMISYAKKKGIKIVSSSNGHLFAKKENARKLVLSGIDSIIIAIDGITQKTYEHYRKSGNLKTAITGIHNIVEQKKLLKSRTPLINFRFIAMGSNEHEIPDLKKLAKSLNVDVLTIKTLNPYSNDTYFENRAVKKENYDSFLPKSAKYQRFKYIDKKGDTQRIRRNPPCKNLWNSPAVHWDGGVFPCTYDYNNKYFFGTLKTDTFKDIWFGRRYQKMRNRFCTNWQKIKLCCNCSYSYKGGSCWNETIAEVLFNSKNADIFSNPENPKKVKSFESIK